MAPGALFVASKKKLKRKPLKVYFYKSLYVVLLVFDSFMCVFLCVCAPNTKQPATWNYSN